MRKKLLALVMASFALFSVAQARFFIGVEGGYTGEAFYGTGLTTESVYFSAPATSIIPDAIERGTQGFTVKGVLGSENFFGNYFGSRWGFGVGYTMTNVPDQDITASEYVDAGLFTDLMLNFFNNGNFSFGVFGGVSADYHYELNWEHHLFDFSGRVGVSTLLARHHRMEIMMTLPIASVNAADSNEVVLGGGIAPARTTIGASYKFVF